MLQSTFLLVAATLAGLGSPGPVTLALAAAGGAFGPRRSAGFLAGILTGLVFVAALSAVGVAGVVSAGGHLTTLLTAVSLAYLTYVAFKIASAPIASAAGEASHVPTFRDGLVLNLTNPKAYAVFAALYTGFALPFDPAWLAILVTALVILLVATFIDVAWLFLGGRLAPAFVSERLGRAMRVGFALAMLASVAGSLWAARSI